MLLGVISLPGFCGKDPCNYLQCDTTERVCKVFSPARFQLTDTLEDFVTKIHWSPGGCFNANDRKSKAVKLGKYANKWDCLDSCRAIPTTTACEWHIKHGDCFAYTKKVTNANRDSILLLCYIFKSNGVLKPRTRHSNNNKWKEAEQIKVPPAKCKYNLLFLICFYSKNMTERNEVQY